MALDEYVAVSNKSLHVMRRGNFHTIKAFAQSRSCRVMTSEQFDAKLAQQSSRADAQANSPSAIKEQFDLIRRVLTGTSYETTDLFRALLRDDFISENGRKVMLGWVAQVQSKKDTPARNRVLIASFKSHDEIKEWASSHETQGVVFVGLKAYRNG